MDLQEQLDAADALLAEKDRALESLAAALRYYAGGPDPLTATDALTLATFAMPDYQQAAVVGAELGPPPLLGEAPRSGKWPAVRRAHMEAHPECAVCGSREQCVPHHMKPFHLFADLELEPSNLITLCPPHHLLVGHLMSWRSYNLTVHADAAHWSHMIADRPKAGGSESP